MLEGAVDAPEEPPLVELDEVEALEEDGLPEEVADDEEEDVEDVDPESEPLEDEEVPEAEAPLELLEDEPVGTAVGGTQVPLAHVQPATPQSAVEEHWLLQPRAPRTPAIANASTRCFMTLSLVDRREAATRRRLATERAEGSTRPAGRSEERCRRNPARL